MNPLTRDELTDALSKCNSYAEVYVLVDGIKYAASSVWQSAAGGTILIDTEERNAD
jgi:hypothetical protein